ncbi:hypothetical protein D3C76_1448980 [compost metagenome]
MLDLGFVAGFPVAHVDFLERATQGDHHWIDLALEALEGAAEGAVEGTGIGQAEELQGFTAHTGRGERGFLFLHALVHLDRHIHAAGAVLFHLQGEFGQGQAGYIALEADAVDEQVQVGQGFGNHCHVDALLKRRNRGLRSATGW